MKIINFEENDTNNKQVVGILQTDKKLLPLQKMFVHKYNNDKIYWKIKDHCHCTGKLRGAAHSICNMKYIIPKEILVDRTMIIIL